MVFVGVIGGAFGLAALLGINERVELEFFGIELNDQSGRVRWVAGSFVTVGAGVFLMRRSRRRSA